jgi:exodeoxyribonuclease VII large subunit
MHLEGTGDLELAFRQLCARLRNDGLFDPAHKKPIPRIPSHLAVVSSPSGAAVQDVLRVLQRRFPCVRVTLCPVAVQGDGAAADMAAMLDRLNRRTDIDTIILARGGGSLQDLWAFNEEVLARALHRSRIPVVTGIGHEVDVTVADLVADLRAATPSAAAEQAVPSTAELGERLTTLRGLLLRQLRERARLARRTLDGLARREPLRMPTHLIRGYRQHLDHLSVRLRQMLAGVRLAAQDCCAQQQALRTALEGFLRSRAAALDSLAKQLQGVNHLSILQRGYTMTTAAVGGSLIRRAAQVQPGQHILTHTAEGSFESQVCPPPASSGGPGT